MKVAFIIPFAFERFFHFAKDLFDDPEQFEDEMVSQRDTWHFNWCRSMVKQGMEVTVYHISLHAAEKREYKHKSGLLIKRFPASFRKFNFRNKYSCSLLKEIAKDRPDIVFSVAHIFGPIVDMYDCLALYCRYKKIPIVTRNAHADTYHHIFPQKKGKITKYNKNIFLRVLRLFYQPVKLTRKYLKFYIKKKSLRSTDCILTQTKEDYKNLIGKFSLPNASVKPFPKPVNLDSFYEISKEVAAEKLGMNKQKKYLLHVSNLFNTKGCEHIIAVLPELKKIFPNIQLLIAGNGPSRGDLELLVKKLGLNENVRFIGQISHEELLYYYNIADVFVLPTKIDVEGQPNVILEAIACNTVPITTNLPGPSSAISDGLGLLAPVGSEKELFYAIKEVLYGNYSIDTSKRELFLSKYSLENVGIELKQLFDNIISVEPK